MNPSDSGRPREGTDFIRAMVARDLETEKYDGRVVTRFPPEPNGFLHIGHAKSICLNFGIAAEHPSGRCHLRFDDTNPNTEEVEFVEAMQEDIRWLGFDWGEHLYYASDYFQPLYEYALVLVDRGLAYVDSSSEEEIRELRGTVTEPGRDSPYRSRSVQENRDLFERMRAGEFPDGSHVLRAKIDMSHPNMVMRDPVLYRIRHAHHYRQGDAWPIYPLYDFAHCLSDSMERITHSLCTLEFENNREIYDWLLEHVDAPAPRPEQTEFARLAIDYVVTSKRHLRPLVEEGFVRGWDDPRMHTLAGLRRRGVTPDAIRAFCEMVGVAKANSQVDLGKLDYQVRDDLNYKAPRAFCVLNPLKVVVTNYPEGEEETLVAPSFPKDVGKPGSRNLPFGRELYMDSDDFSEDPPAGFRRLTPGGEVRLKYAYAIRCDEVVRDKSSGRVTELRCTYDPETRGGTTPDGRRIKGTIHWLSADHAVPAEVRAYDRLFRVPDPGDVDDVTDALNPDSEVVHSGALVEPEVAGAPGGSHYQFERLGYFFTDPVDSRPEGLVFNRTIALRDSWSRGVAEDTKPVSGQEGHTEAAAAAGDPVDPGGTLRTAAERARFEAFTSAGVQPVVAASLARSTELSQVFESARKVYSGAPSLASWLTNDVARAIGQDPEARLENLDPSALAELARRAASGTLSHRQGRAILTSLLTGGGTLDEAASRVDLEEIDDDDALTAVLEPLLDEFPDKVQAYKNGQHGLLGFFVGEVMKRTGGKADPRRTGQLAESMLAE